MNFKDFDIIDIGLTKMSVFFATLFIVSAWSAFAEWAIGVHWAWFLVIGLALAVKPTMKTFK